MTFPVIRHHDARKIWVLIEANAEQIEDLTLEGEFVPARDNEQLQWLKGRVGKGRAGAVENGLDVDGNVIGILNRWTGILQSVDTGIYDATSSDPRTFVIMVECDGPPA